MLGVVEDVVVICDGVLVNGCCPSIEFSKVAYKAWECVVDSPGTEAEDQVTC